MKMVHHPIATTFLSEQGYFNFIQKLKSFCKLFCKQQDKLSYLHNYQKKYGLNIWYNQIFHLQF